MKPVTQNRGWRLSPKVKAVAVVAVALLAPVHLSNSGYEDWHSGADTAYVLALLLLFRAKEPVEDERVQALRLRALSLAFFGGWVLAGVGRFAVYLQNTEVSPRTMSAYDVMFAMLLLAHALFRWWRFQDGRVEEPAPSSR